MSKTKLIPKHKIGHILDYDPKNPYHVHNNGEKIAITPEQYEKHKNEPYFTNIRKQVEEHQAAYPSPEYTETPNPEYRKVYANVKAASNQHFKEHNVNNQSYREYSVVPKEYFRNSIDGVVTDEQGNLYRPMTQSDVGKGVTPMFTTTERDYRNGRDFDMSWVRVKTPSKTIKTLKQPLPVDRTYDVDGELDIIYKQPYKYKLISDIWEKDDSRVMPRSIYYTIYDDALNGSTNSVDLDWDIGGMSVSKKYYDKLKTKLNNDEEQKYFKSNYVKPVYPTKDYVNKNIKLSIHANSRNLLHKGGLIQKHQRGQKITQKNPEYNFTVDFRKYVNNHNYPEYERSDEDKKKFNRFALKQYVSNQLKKYSDNIKNVDPNYYYSEYLPYLKSLKDSTVVSEIPVWSVKANGYELSNLNDLISYIENGYGTGGIEIFGFNDYVKSVENTYNKYERTPTNPQYRKYLINKNKDENSLYEASQFVLDYYSSPGYKERATKYNIERTPLRSHRKVKVLNAKPGEGSETHPYLNYIKLDEDDAKNFTYPYIISHELGHFNPLYNTRSNAKTDDSPYSNHDYSDVPPKYKDILSGHDYENDHDAELSENYSDLMGLRESLFRLGIFDSKKSGSIFTSKMLNEYRKTKEGEKNRFLKYHTDQQIIDAVNEIAYNGSKELYFTI